MRASKFCSECGERITVEGRRLWPARIFCARCAPKFRRARLLTAAAVTLLVASGFIIGRYTSPREPFYFIGTPIDPRSGRVLSVEQNEVAAEDERSAAVAHADNSAVKPNAITEAMCGARTKAGKPCRRKVRGGGYCWQHRKQKEYEAQKTEGGGQ